MKLTYDRANSPLGLLFGVILCGLAVYLASRSGWVVGWGHVVLAAAGLFFLGLAFIHPSALRVPRHLWMSIGPIMSRVIGPVVLALIYFGPLLMIGLLTKLIGRDRLTLRNKPRDTFWREVKPSEPDYRNQF